MDDRTQNTRRRGPLRFDDPEIALELACENEKRSWTASRVGLPPIGSRLLNQYGIEWVVQGHLEAPTIETVRRWERGEFEPRIDLYPVLTPTNLTTKLAEFICVVQRCTTKTFAMLDTMPGQRSGGHLPGHNYLDTAASPLTNILFLDAARVHETVIAHEFGHAWVQYIDECEDERTLRAGSDPARLRQVNYVQSFVLDLRVNDLIRNKGFDMSPIELDQTQCLVQLAAALRKGYRPAYAREEVFMALLLADHLVRREREALPAISLFDQSLAVVRELVAPVSDLAREIAEIVASRGYHNREAILQCIDECLLCSFAHCGETFDLDREMVVVKPEAPDLDKFPDWLPMLPPRQKCIVGKHMARNDISTDWAYSVSPALNGGTKVQFYSVEGLRSSRVIVDHHIGPPSPYTGMPEELAEGLNMRRLLEDKKGRPFGPVAHFPPVVRKAMEAVTGPQRDHGQRESPVQPKAVVRRPGRFYMAGAGRFCTAVRLAEQLIGEHPYAYALNNPATLNDPLGLSPRGGRRHGLPGGGFGDCGVYVCYENTSFTRHIPGHESICVTGPHGGCSGGFYPTGNGLLSGGTALPNPYGCKAGWHTESDMRGGTFTVFCDKVSSSCNDATTACACIKSSTSGWYAAAGSWVVPLANNCYTWATNIVDCTKGFSIIPHNVRR